MKYRKLRIAWSVAWGAVAVLLLMTWSISYFWVSYFSNDVDNPKVRFRSQMLTISSSRGSLYVTSQPGIMWPHSYGWHGGTFKVTKSLKDYQNRHLTRSWLKLDSSPTGYQFQLSYVPVFLTFASIGAVPWVFTIRRFSLRTLLIATTLVAVVLGLIVWLR